MNINRKKPTRDFFSGVWLIISDYVLLSCRKNKNAKSRKVLAAGVTGGMHRLDPKKNGEGGLAYDISSDASVIPMLQKQFIGSMPEGQYNQSLDPLIEYIMGISIKNIKSNEQVNAVRETIEESGIIVVDFDNTFHYSQTHPRYGPQTFFLADRALRFSFNEVSFDFIESLSDQVPVNGLDFKCLDPELVGTRVVHIDEVFTHPDIEIIETHVDSLKSAISHYRKNKST